MKDWFRSCAEAIVKLMQTVEWITPLGLPVYQPYLETKMEDNKVYRLPKSIKQVCFNCERNFLVNHFSAKTSRMLIVV